MTSKPTEHNVQQVTREAENDLSDHENRAVVPGTSDDEVAKAGADADAIAILGNAPAAGEKAECQYFGIMRAEAGGSFSFGDQLATDSNGRLVSATDANVDTTSSSASQDVAGSPVVAVAWADAGASGEVVPVFFFGVGALV